MSIRNLRSLLIVAVAVLSALSFACGRTASPEQGQNINIPNPNPGPSPVPFSLSTVFNLYGLGAFPNRITIDGDFAYVVNSGSNNIQRINILNGTQTTPFFTSPGSGANPWELLIRGNLGYVSNFVANTVDVLNMSTGALVTTIVPNGSGIFNEPEGLAVASNGLIFVANADFDPFFNQGPGFITVIDSATNQVVNQIPTTQQNPQYVVARGNTVYVVNSGAGIFDFAGCGCFRPVSDGGIDILDATTGATATTVNDNILIPLDGAFPLRGFPGSFAVNHAGNAAYLGSNSGVMFKVDLSNNTLLRGNSNPIAITPDATDNLIETKIDSTGIVWILSFNEDAAYLLDSSNDTPLQPSISLNSDPSNLEGPLDMAFHNSGNYPDVYVLMSVSEELSAIITN